MSLSGAVVLVTGATRGIGKGIALEFGKVGATVYITGRSLLSKPGLPGGLQQTANEIADLGGKCIPVQCDHAVDEDIQKLFQQIESEQSGRLDVLVNCAYSAVQAITRETGKKFYENPIGMWDTVNHVGLRNHYLCSWHAAQLMVPRKNGLIVNVSSPGGLFSIFNTAYGIGKDAVDRMAVDCGKDLRKQRVTYISCWPGPVSTEHIDNMLEKLDNSTNAQKTRKIFENAESPEFVGKVLVAFSKDPKRHASTGKVLITVDLADKYGIKMDNGTRPASVRWFGNVLQQMGIGWLAFLIPYWFKIPRWLLWLSGNRIG